MVNLKVFATKHKKLLLYAGAGAAGYFVLWPQVANFVTQSQGAIANPPGSPSPPAYVPIYTGNSPLAPAVGPTLVPGWTNLFYNDPLNPTGGAHFPDGVPVVQPVYRPGSPTTPITGPGGYGHVGDVPVPGSSDQLTRINPVVSHPPVIIGSGMSGN